MNVAVIGSRGLTVPNLGAYLPPKTTRIVSGGAGGVDACARAYALENNLPLTEFLPDYARYGWSAPLRRNMSVVLYSDLVLAFSDGAFRGTAFVMDQCRRLGVPLRAYAYDPEERIYALLSR